MVHIIELIRPDDPWQWAFYENECLRGSWSERELQRLYVSRYLVALPKPNEIQQLIERDRALWDQHGGRNRPQLHDPSKW